MNRHEQRATLELLRDELSGFDFITRREVLKRLLKSGALFRIVSFGGAGAVASLIRSAPAWAQGAVSDGAMSEPGPDRQFELSRLWFGYGSDGALDIIIGPVGEAAGDSGCSDQQCGGNVCDVDSCGGLVCDDNSCDSQRCGNLGCTDDSCTYQGCGPNNSCDNNVCSEDTGDSEPGCFDTNSCDEQGAGAMNPADFLDKYGDTRFARDLEKLFGDDLVKELNDMLKTGASLRDRGLLGPESLRRPTGLTPAGHGALLEGLPSPSDLGMTDKGAPTPPSGDGAAGQGPSPLDGVGPKTPPLRRGPDQLTPEGMEMRLPPPPSTKKTPVQ